MKILIAENKKFLCDSLKRIIGEHYVEATFLFSCKFPEICRISKQLLSSQDIMIININVFESKRLFYLKAILESSNNTPILIVLEDNLPIIELIEFMDIGIKGIMSLQVNGDSIKSIIEILRSGEAYVPYEMYSTQLGDLDNVDSSLTKRESKILFLISQGMSNKELAKYLDIQCNTIKVHTRSIYTKLGVNSRTEAAHVYVSKFYRPLAM